ncbi:MAG: hypothetical protein ACT6Q7_02670 [Blastomonas fulva]
MFGFISKRAHDAEIKILADARDHLVRSLNDLETSLAKSRARVARLEIDNQALGKQVADIDGQIAANARYIKVGKARLETLARQNERAKAKRRAA